MFWEYIGAHCMDNYKHTNNTEQNQHVSEQHTVLFELEMTQHRSKQASSNFFFVCLSVITFYFVFLNNLNDFLCSSIWYIYVSFYISHCFPIILRNWIWFNPSDLWFINK